MKPISTQQSSAKDKKLQKFLEELNQLCEDYQYRLQPTLRYSPQGVTPTFDVVNVPPKRKKTRKNGELKKGKK
jgi:hypothetical protein